MSKQIFNFQNLGQSLVELVLLMGLLAVLLPVLMTGFASSREGKAQQKQRLKATALLKETEEAVRSVREKDWVNFAQNGIFHPVSNADGTWSLSVDPITTNGFIQQITISNVYRDIEDKIAPTGRLDPSTKKIVITISWTQPYISSITSTAYLTRRDNLVYTESCTTHFDSGNKYGTAVVETSTNPDPRCTSQSLVDGEVKLAAGGAADWCQPKLTIEKYNISGNGVGVAVSSVAGSSPGQPNQAYITTGENASSYSLYSLTITNPLYPDPPVPSTYQYYNNHKDYGVFANNSYVFVTTDHPSLTVDIVNKSTFTQAGYYGLGDKPAYSVFISGNTGYVTAGKKLYAFDVTTIEGPSQSQNTLWSVNLLGNATGQKVIVLGNYAYIASSATTDSRQLQVVDLTSHNIYTPPASGGQSINTDKPGVDLAVVNNFVYLVTNYKTSGDPDFFVIDISTPSSPTVVGRATTTGGMNPTGIATTPGNVVIVVGSGGDQYQVFNVSTPSSPSQCGKLKDPNGAQKINAVSTLQETDNDVYSYILTTNGGNQQFQIIAGGPGGQTTTSGTFTSKIFEPGYQTAFNRFIANASLPSAATTIKYQVASTLVGMDGTCATATFTFIGPDTNNPSGYSTNGYFTGNGIIPYGNLVSGYQNPGSCFQYKVYFNTTDTNQTPIFNDMTINFSP